MCIRDRPQGGASAIAAALKRTNVVSTVSDVPSEGTTAPKVKEQTDSTKLRQFLNNLPGDE